MVHQTSPVSMHEGQLIEVIGGSWFGRYLNTHRFLARVVAIEDERILVKPQQEFAEQADNGVRTFRILTNGNWLVNGYNRDMEKVGFIGEVQYFYAV
jgi:hypothetical protein